MPDMIVRVDNVKYPPQYSESLGKYCPICDTEYETPGNQSRGYENKICPSCMGKQKVTSRA